MHVVVEDRTPYYLLTWIDHASPLLLACRPEYLLLSGVSVPPSSV